jgi:hypothetical protein
MPSSYLAPYYVKEEEEEKENEDQKFIYERIYLPQHLNEPLAIIAIRSPSSSASSIECVVSNIILPFFIFFINCHVKRIEYGSIPLVGSSRIITCNDKKKEPSQ